MGQLHAVSRDQKVSKICGEELKQLLDGGDDEAVKIWIKSLSKKFCNARDQWQAVSYAVTNAECWGRHRFMMELAIKQIEIAQEIKTKYSQSDLMGGESLISINTSLADSYLSLARSNLWLSEFQKCSDYCAKSLNFIGKCRGASNDTTKRITGEIHLCRGSAQLRLGNFKNALEDLERALGIATGQQNTDLECLSCCALGRLYVDLKDYEKATFFPLKASEILYRKDTPRNRTLIHLHMSEAYRKAGKLGEAMASGEEAMKYAIENGDRSSQAYCLLAFADIHRASRDPNRAFPRYESASSIMREIGDRYGEVRAMVGKAKMYLRQKEYTQTITTYENALKISKSINAKMERLTIYGELALAYQRMNKLQEARDCTVEYHKLLKEMDLYCGGCNQPISEKHEQLEALPCSHIFHLRCVSDTGLANTRACPTCRKKMTKSIRS